MKLTTNYGSCVDLPYGSHPDYIMFDCHKEPNACIACYNPRVEGDFLVWDCDIGNHDNQKSQLYRYGEIGEENV